jgi:rhodanese-related sulfurtransferase
LQRASGLELRAVSYLDGIIHDIEVNIWDAPTHPHSAWVEALYRSLQARYRRDQVPVDCYLAFFDSVARLSEKTAPSGNDFSQALDLKDQCPGTAPTSGPGTLDFIPPMNHVSILRSISLGNKVVFVDTREDDEYTEVHLPGARVLRLRDVDDDTVRSLSKADLVVPYCVKDFRGFEVAKALKRRGLDQVATLSPNGLKGWLNAGLPVVRPDGLSTDEAMDALMRCAMEPARCLGDGNGS